MADTTTLKKLMGIFNNYIADNTATSFSEFCTAHSYTMIDGKGNTTLNTDEINKLTDVDHLDFSKADQNIIQHKLEEIIGFIYNHNRQIPYSIKELNITLKDIINYLEENGKHLSFSDEEADKLIDKFQTSVDTGDITVPKTRRKTLWATKKIGIPTLITAGVCGIISGIIAASGAVVGALPFLTDSIALNVATMASLGVIVGAIAAPIVIVAKNAITRTYYKSKYGRNSDSLKVLLDSNIKSKEDIKSLNMDIVKLLDLIKKTDDKLIQYKTEKVNPFKRAWRTVKSYFMRKTNRNRMHEVIAFTKMLESKADSALTQDELDKYKFLYDYIDEFWGNNIVDNYSKLRQLAANKGKETKKTKVQNLDILAKANMTKKDKKRKSLVLARAKKLIQRAILRNMLTGKAGSVLDHKFNNFGEAEAVDSEVVNIPAYKGNPETIGLLPASGRRLLNGSTSDVIILPASLETTTSDTTENDEELPLLRLAEENTKRGEPPSNTATGARKKRSPLVADRIALMHMEEIMLKMLSDNDLDEISKETGYDTKVLANLKKALATKQKLNKPLAKYLRTYKEALGDDPEKLYKTIADLAKADAVDAMVRSAGID